MEKVLKGIKTIPQPTATESPVFADKTALLEIVSPYIASIEAKNEEGHNIMNPEGKEIFVMARKYISETEFKIDDEEPPIVELHSYICTSGKEIKSQFSLHVDQEGPLSAPCVTCIFYLENSFEYGGELTLQKRSEIYGDYESALLMIDPRRFFCIVMGGDIWHTILNCVGNGKRYSITVQFPLKK